MSPHQLKKLPNHVAIIPDGNRRWAKEKGLPSFIGHQKGFEAVVQLTRDAREMAIHTLTLWGFSTENWKRDTKEVEKLMDIFTKMVTDFQDELVENNVRFTHLGRKDRLPQKLVNVLAELEEKTKTLGKHQLNIALDYGGRDEVQRAIQKALAEGKGINEETIAAHLDTAGQKYPDPDLIIRTSGEMRTSGLMIWQAAYAEYYAEQAHFPDFNREKLKKALAEYDKRERRFGGN